MKKYLFKVHHVYATTHIIEAKNPHHAIEIFDSQDETTREYGEKTLVRYEDGGGPAPVCGNCGEAPETVLDLFPNWEPDGPKCCDKPSYSYEPEELEFMEEVESDPYKFA